MDVSLAEVAGSTVFLRSPAPYLLVDRRMRIQGVNGAYLTATGRSAEELTGMDIFEAFPDNPADPGADGVLRLSASLERVLREGRAHDMLLQRYDIPSAASSSGFIERLWSPLNSPIVDVAGRPVGVLHHVEDVTEAQRLAGWDPGSAPITVDGAAWLPRDPAALAPVLRARLRQVASIAARARAGQDTSPEEGGRLVDALVRVVASRGFAGPSAIRARRAELWREIVERVRRPGWHGWADALCGTVPREVPGAHGAALSVRTVAGAHEVLGASDRWAAELDELHLTVGHGPALTALATGLPVLVADLARESARWPGYAEAAGGGGGAAVHAFPVRVERAPVATLTVFGRVPGALSVRAAADVAVLADLAGTVVAHDLDGAFTDAFGAAVDLHGPAADIAVASGIISARHRLGVDDALARLRAAAYARGLPLARLAADIVAGHATLD